MTKFFLLWKFFVLFFSALLPLVNPLGSALIFVGFVGPAPIGVFRSLARSIAINTFLFFLVIELVGAAILNFFGISLPIVEVSGGLVIASMGWSLLNQKDSDPGEKKLEVKEDEAELTEILLPIHLSTHRRPRVACRHAHAQRAGHATLS
jgi:multiple antibiotic resistance protein